MIDAMFHVCDNGWKWRNLPRDFELEDGARHVRQVEEGRRLGGQGVSGVRRQHPAGARGTGWDDQEKRYRVISANRHRVEAPAAIAQVRQTDTGPGSQICACPLLCAGLREAAK